MASRYSITDLFQADASRMIIGDGGIATMLQAAGLPVGQAPEWWNLRHPERVTALHRQYAKAGALWSTTNTFGANRVRLAQVGLETQVEAVNRAAVACARATEHRPPALRSTTLLAVRASTPTSPPPTQKKACRAAEATAGRSRRTTPGVERKPILGSLGPTTSPHPSDWEAAYREQAEALAAAGVDGFLVETIISLPEGRAAVRAVVETGSAPVIATYTPGAEGGLLDGTAPEAALEALAAAGAAAIGVNCGEGPESLLGPARRLVSATVLPVFAAPNAGLPEREGQQLVYRLSPDGFADAAIQFQDVGVRLFAGCCGTTPAHIRAARRRAAEAEL